MWYTWLYYSFWCMLWTLTMCVLLQVGPIEITRQSWSKVAHRALEGPMWCQKDDPQSLKLTRITQEWAQAMWALGFVLILRDLICGIKDGRSTLTKTDCSRTSQIHHDIIRQVRRFIHPMTALTFNKAEPHHPSRTTSSSRAIQEVSRGISAEIHRKPTKILGSRLASSPS